MILKILSLLLLAFQINSAVTCPEECQCEKGTFSCQACLEDYFITYSLQQQQCQCLPNFILTPQLKDYCHPIPCKQSDWWGCVSCYPHASVNFVESYQYNNCTCDTNYYLNLTTSYCRCLSLLQPTKYYQDLLLDKCLPCPNGCTCDKKGCSFCNGWTLRQVKTNQYYLTCYCKKPSIQVNGTCQCPLNCVCKQNGQTTCNQLSNRQLVLGFWICKSPYVEINGICSCQQPYTILETLGNVQCVCKSKLNYYDYYEANGTCYQCSQDCLCDQIGCTTCYTDGFVLQYQQCFCGKNYIQLLGTCNCLDPYEQVFNQDLEQYQCLCLSYRLENYYSSNDFCAKCPNGCQCNQKGCSNCIDPLRKYISIPSSQFKKCLCSDQSQEYQGICRCKSLFIFNQTSKNCVCRIIPNLIYYDQETKNCLRCPSGCVCDTSGCFSCIPQANRQVKQNQFKKFTCFCGNNYIQINGICECKANYTKTQSGCECIDPNEINNQGQCVCKSQKDSSKYIYDIFQKKCKYCPSNCICNINGCVRCSSDSLRTILYSIQSFYFRCPCYQNAFLVGNECTVCKNNSYPQYTGSFDNITCIQCPKCATCNRFGCLSCFSGMTLIGKSCVCDKDILININGVCRCNYSYYLSQEVCKKCPSNCKNCYQSQNKVLCSSCKSNVNRKNMPQQGCLCLQNYKQSSLNPELCCSKNCQDCNFRGCTSCPSQTYRILFKNSCVCSNGFVQGGDIKCICPQGNYMLNNQCFRCPIECLTCGYNSTKQIIQCLSCRQKSHRNLSSSSCDCLPYFQQTSPFKSQFCYASFCASQVLNCTNCINSWKLDQKNGYCVCNKGFYIQSKICIQCSIEGCTNCLDQFTCVECNQQQNYYLIQTFCSKVTHFEYLLIQSPQSIIIQFSLDESLPQIQEVSGSLNFILDPNPQTIKEEIQLNIIAKELINNGSILFIQIQNLAQTYERIIISFIIQGSDDIRTMNTMTKLNSDQSTEQTILNVNLKIDTFYSQQTFNSLQTNERFGLYFFIILTMVVAFIFYIYGYKHNQICYFMQVMSLLGFVIPDKNLTTSMFLYNLRYSYYNYSQHSILSNIIPFKYLEKSLGNYRYLSFDSNIIRNIGIPLILALLIATISLFGRAFYFATQERQFIKPIGLATHVRKTLYRVIQFFYKTLMFPLMYFSLQNFTNWIFNIVSNDSFQTKCLILSIIIVLGYTLITMYQFLYQMTNIYNQRQNLREFLNCLCGSLIILACLYSSKFIFLFFVVFIVNQIPLIKWKLKDSIHHKIHALVRIITVLFQVINIILIYNIAKTALVGVFTVTVLLQICCMVYKSIIDKLDNMMNKLTNSQLNEQKDPSSEATKQLKIDDQ